MIEVKCCVGSRLDWLVFSMRCIRTDGFVRGRNRLFLLRSTRLQRCPLTGPRSWPYTYENLILLYWRLDGLGWLTTRSWRIVFSIVSQFFFLLDLMTAHKSPEPHPSSFPLCAHHWRSKICVAQTKRCLVHARSGCFTKSKTSNEMSTTPSFQTDKLLSPSM